MKQSTILLNVWRYHTGAIDVNKDGRPFAVCKYMHALTAALLEGGGGGR